MAKDKFIGFLLMLIALAGILAESYFLVYLPLFDSASVTMDSRIFWALSIPVFIGTLFVLVIALWIGWTMVTTPPPEPINLEEFSDDLEAAGSEEKNEEKQE